MQHRRETTLRELDIPITEESELYKTCDNHSDMIEAMTELSSASARADERFIGFLRFAKWIGSVTFIVLCTIAWIGVMLFTRIDQISHEYQAADISLTKSSYQNRADIEINRKVTERVEKDLAYIRRIIENFIATQPQGQRQKQIQSPEGD